MKIIPTILTNDIQEVKDKLQKLTGLTNRIQIDIIDGIFAANKTIDLASLIKAEHIKEFKFDLHLMVKKPLRLIKEAKKLNLAGFIAHVEEVKDQKDYLKTIMKARLQPGLAIDLETPLKLINLRTWEKLKLFLLLAVKAGAGGQEFNPSVLTKIEQVNKLKNKNNFQFEICVDGGINYKTATLSVAAGADSIAVNSFLWQQKDIERTVLKFRQIEKRK